MTVKVFDEGLVFHFEGCDLTDVKFQDCQINGMQINGIPVKDLLEAYKRK